MNLIYITTKKRYHNLENTPKENFILALWHGNLFMIPFLYKKMRKSRANIDILISEHRDGEIIAKVMKYLNLDSIRGSSRRGAKRVLLNALKSIKVKDVAITPDGPKGPRYSIASGVVVIAQKSNSRIVPVSYKANSFWQFDSWDKFIIPKPFTTIDFFVGEPIESLSDDLNESKQIVYNSLMKLERVI
jgi:lysophospholipid acyltransferase (LPLAT)-like uncharacterized protein